MTRTASAHLAIVETPGSETWSNKIRRRARTIARTIDRGFLELAEIIYTVWSTPIDGDANRACVCVSWGYHSYIQWAEEELGLKRRKIIRLKAIWTHFEDTLKGGINQRTRVKLFALGLSKVRELIRVIDAENVERWIEVAENLSQQELERAIQLALQEQEESQASKDIGDLDADDDDEDDDDEEEEFQGAPPPEDIDRFKCRAFSFTPEQRENVRRAMARASELAESKKEGHLLDLICTDFLATNDFRLSDDPDIGLRYLAKFERLMGRRIVVINPDTNQIEYGIEALERLAGG